MLLGALASSPSPAKVEASHRQVGPVPRFLLLGSQLVLRPESSCLPGHAWACLLPFACPRRSNASWDGGRWLVCSAFADNIPASPLQSSAQARSCLGRRSVSCAAYPSRRHSIVPNVPFSPCAAPLGAAARGGPQGARCVPRPAPRAARARVVGPLRRRPDLSDAEHTVGYEASASVLPPKASVRRFVANDARHRFGPRPMRAGRGR
ncbi:UNVERIFIED_CONTAM: hypothetical protein Sindi_3110700, partial [Sesamum indicum]